MKTQNPRNHWLGPIAAQIQTLAADNLVDEPEHASSRHDQTKRVDAHDTLPLATLLLPQTAEGIRITNFDSHFT
jgi:hypothetical protein